MNPSWRKNYHRYRAIFLNAIARYRQREDAKAYLEILLSLLTVSILAVFALRPTLLTISQLVKEIEAKRQTLAQLNSKIDNLVKAQTLYNNERESIERLKEAIPTDPEPDVLVRQFEGLSSSTQTPLSGLALGQAVVLGSDSTDIPPNFPPNTNGITFRTSVGAEYPTLFNFLTNLTNARRPLVIERLDLRIQDDAEQSGLVMGIDGKAPYAKAATQQQ